MRSSTSATEPRHTSQDSAPGAAARGDRLGVEQRLLLAGRQLLPRRFPALPRSLGGRRRELSVRRRARRAFQPPATLERSTPYCAEIRAWLPASARHSGGYDTSEHPVG